MVTEKEVPEELEEAWMTHTYSNRQSLMATVINGKDNPHVPQSWLSTFWLCRLLKQQLGDPYLCL